MSTLKDLFFQLKNIFLRQKISVSFLALFLEFSSILNRNTKHHKEAWLRLYLNKNTLLYFGLYLVLILHYGNFLNFLVQFLFYNILNPIRDYDINEHHCHFILKGTNKTDKKVNDYKVNFLISTICKNTFIPLLSIFISIFMWH